MMVEHQALYEIVPFFGIDHIYNTWLQRTLCGVPYAPQSADVEITMQRCSECTDLIRNLERIIS